MSEPKYGPRPISPAMWRQRMDYIRRQLAMVRRANDAAREDVQALNRVVQLAESGAFANLDRDVDQLFAKLGIPIESYEAKPEPPKKG